MKMRTWVAGMFGLCGLMDSCVATEVLITVFEGSEGGLARRPAFGGEPHVERRIDGEQHTLIIHHREGEFVLTPGFSSDSILRNGRSSNWVLSDSTLEELCRWAQPMWENEDGKKG